MTLLKKFSPLKIFCAGLVTAGLVGCSSPKNFPKYHPYSAGGNFGYEEKWVDDTRVLLRYTSKLERSKKPPEPPEKGGPEQKISDEGLRLAILRAAELANARRFPYFRVLKKATQMETSQFSSKAGGNLMPMPTSGAVMMPGGGSMPMSPSTASENNYSVNMSPRHDGYGYQIKTALQVEMLMELPRTRDDTITLSTQAILNDGRVYLDEAKASEK